MHDNLNSYLKPQHLLDYFVVLEETPSIICGGLLGTLNFCFAFYFIRFTNPTLPFGELLQNASVSVNTSVI